MCTDKHSGELSISAIHFFAVRYQATLKSEKNNTSFKSCGLRSTLKQKETASHEEKYFFEG